VRTPIWLVMTRSTRNPILFLFCYWAKLVWNTQYILSITIPIFYHLHLHLLSSISSYLLNFPYYLIDLVFVFHVSKVMSQGFGYHLKILYFEVKSTILQKSKNFLINGLNCLLDLFNGNNFYIFSTIFLGSLFIVLISWFFLFNS